MITTDPQVISKEFTKRFKAVATNIDEGLEEVGQRGVNYLKIESTVFENPTGRLRASMSYTVDSKVYKPLPKAENTEPEDYLGRNAKKETVYIGTNVIYGPSVEYRATNGSQGYMYRAYKRLKQIAPKILKQAMQRGMK